jgi:uncharacterized SAM-binding protein YcdF (DUF218 family)
MIVFALGVTLFAWLTSRLWLRCSQRDRRWWLDLAGAVAAAALTLVALATSIVAQKAFALLLMPAGLAWVLLIAVTIASWRSSARPLAVLASIALAGYTLAGNAWVGDALIATLERRIPPYQTLSEQPFEAVFVLGGGTEFSDADGGALGPSGDRVALAARLWHTKRAGVLVSSGTSIGTMEHERDLAAETAGIWRGLGIPATAIVQIPPGAVNTTQEIAAYKTLITARGWQRVGLISSAWHLPRALSLCQRAGLTMVPLGADRKGRFRSWSLFWLIPQEHGFDRVQRACWEYLGMLIGR